MGTPVPIPNTAVKHCSGDGTRKGRVASRQHRVFEKTPRLTTWRFPFN